MMKALCILVFLTAVFYGAEEHEGHHHHEHEHASRDAAKFRYSKQANVDAAAGNFHEDGQHDHHHDHDHGHHHYGHDHHHHDHGHNHDDHHHGHGHHHHHGHDHDHHHDHDHGHDHHDHDHHYDHGHHHHGHDHDHHGHDHDHHHDHGHDHHDHDHHHDHGHHHHDHGQDHVSNKKVFRVDQDLWLYALGSTTLISAAPFFILFFIPLQSNDAEFQPLLKVLLSFASGGLLGDAFLHLIPHAVEYQNHHSGVHDHHHHHGHSSSERPHVHDLTIGLSVIGGFVLFLLIEKFVRLCNGGEHSHSHGGHSHAEKPKKEKKNGDHDSPMKNKKDKDGNNKAHEKTDDNDDDVKDNDRMSESKDAKEKSCDIVKHEAHHDVKVSGYLNLVADFTHNFTDGLTIATSYLLGHQIGIVSTVTILFHEIPHEIGDFSILIQSGFSKRKAIMMQLVTAVGALSGTLIGLLAQGLGDEIINLYILPFTAGGFIYIATVSVIPELLEENKFVPTVVQLVAMFLGVYLMVVISWYE
ncbi:zinc transporter Slc39a7-like [Convolutriloba macropyga]|uniref:zinc transporter Slc39a7-like n=1 Tax=Convolutriloba macropyga TaxID=536237 RepID=UPI003F51EE3C